MQAYGGRGYHILIFYEWSLRSNAINTHTWCLLPLPFCPSNASRTRDRPVRCAADLSKGWKMKCRIDFPVAPSQAFFPKGGGGVWNFGTPILIRLKIHTCVFFCSHRSPAQDSVGHVWNCFPHEYLCLWCAALSQPFPSSLTLRFVVVPRAFRITRSLPGWNDFSTLIDGIKLWLAFAFACKRGANFRDGNVVFVFRNALDMMQARMFRVQPNRNEIEIIF